MRIPCSFKEVLAGITSILTAIGSTADLWTNTQTLFGYSNVAYKHVHNSSYVVPDDCTTIDVVTGAGGDTFGDFVEIIANTAEPLDFHWANIVEVGALGVYIIEFHIVDGSTPPATDTYLGTISVSRLDTFTKASQVTVQVPVIPAGVRVGCRVKGSGAGENTVKFNIIYHDYQ